MAFRGRIRPSNSLPALRLLSTAQNDDWRLLLWRGRPDTHTSVEATARRLPRRDSYPHEDSGPSEHSDDPGAKARAVTYTILAINTVVFGAWFVAKNAYTYQKDKRQLEFMLQNFTASLANLKAGRVWTLLTAAFSHQELWHFGLNSVCIYSFAPIVCQLLGPGTFIAFYMTTGIISCLTTIGWNSFVKDRKIQSLGASGAVYGSISFLACLFPHAQFLILGIIPAPAWACVTGFLAFDLWGALSPNPRPIIDSAGHIGGAVSGIAYYLIRRQRYKRLFRR